MNKKLIKKLVSAFLLVVITIACIVIVSLASKKTYHNNELNFSFKYPRNFGDLKQADLGSEDKLFFFSKNSLSPSVRIENHIASPVNDQCVYLADKCKTYLNKNNVKIMKFTYEPFFNYDENILTEYEVTYNIVVGENKSPVISVSSDKKNEKISDAIIDTFKFIK